ncbi:3-oxoacyl-ACP reductase family protein [Aquamicrobium sp. LC103]|uniref:SDR family NAD(P)-dependent oxidoreductase n=1 Tax=Aquamicrobium sp. LC103 TaxID=1120658 RepID=UPI00063E834A|nr:3-oxoacyl-ACP reductase family protein [Aquamicrobium sp. LC103]TKT69813.1 3-oxoacyl-ACP reductase FabG [Aquamicrobium sp. LC103]
MTTVSPLRQALDDLLGKVVIVTGGGRGLGRAIAEGFVAEGCRVAIIGRDRETLEHAAAEMGSKVLPCPADIADEDQVAALCATVRDRWGRIDVLVNNAGVNPFYKRAEHTDHREWQQIIDVNLTGVFFACKHAGRVMLDQGAGSIVNITSVAAKVALDRTTAYCAAKAGVERMTAELGFEWARRGVRVNAVGPGYFATDLTEGLRENEALAEKITARTPMGRFGRPDELVGACLFLASDAAGYVTGSTLMVDGGWTAC